MKKKPGATLEPQTVAGTPVPEKPKSAIKIIFQWFWILAFLAGVYFLARYVSIEIPKANLQHHQIILLAFSLAFTWVYIFKWGSVKPFNCVTCMSGWFALIIGFWCHGWMGFIYMPVAMTVAALYSEIRMRWL